MVDIMAIIMVIVAIHTHILPSAEISVALIQPFTCRHSMAQQMVLAMISPRMAMMDAHDPTQCQQPGGLHDVDTMYFRTF